jgi:hypothetical protein
VRVVNWEDFAPVDWGPQRGLLAVLVRESDLASNATAGAVNRSLVFTV